MDDDLGETALNDSVQKLNDTATSLTELLRIVDRNQALLVDLQETSYENSEAIAHRSTKVELRNEIRRSARERRRDQTRTKLGIAATLLLVVALGMASVGYRSARTEANASFSRISQEVCQQRSVTWDAMQEYIRTQQGLLVRDNVTNHSLKDARLAAYAKLLRSFPDVDCTRLGTGLAITQPTPTKGLGNLAEALWVTTK